MSLYFAGRSSQTVRSVIQKFKAFAVSQGFPTESILTPPPAGKVEETHVSIHMVIQHAHTDNGDPKVS